MLDLLGIIPEDEINTCAQATRIYLQLLRHPDPNVVARAINTAVGYQDTEAVETTLGLMAEEAVQRSSPDNWVRLLTERATSRSP